VVAVVLTSLDVRVVQVVQVAVPQAFRVGTVATRLLEL